MAIDSSAAPRGRSWLPDKNPVRLTGAQLMLALGLLLVVGGVVAAVSGYPGSTPAFLASMGTACIALAALEVARPTSDRRAVVVYRFAFYLLPVCTYVAFLTGDL
jgi:hypothetical protein